MQDDFSFLQRRALPAGRQIRVLIVVALIAAVLLLVWMLLGRKSAAAAGPPLRRRGGQGATQRRAAGNARHHHRPDRGIPQRCHRRRSDRRQCGHSHPGIFSLFGTRRTGAGRHRRPGPQRCCAGELDASENLDAQSTLITALSQARLARLIETRRHAAYDSHGGSLQDWQQAQAELTSAEATLSAARGRLRVLGRSDAQIQALETAGVVNPTATI